MKKINQKSKFCWSTKFALPILLINKIWVVNFVDQQNVHVWCMKFCWSTKFALRILLINKICVVNFIDQQNLRFPYLRKCGNCFGIHRHKFNYSFKVPWRCWLPRSAFGWLLKAMTDLMCEGGWPCVWYVAQLSCLIMWFDEVWSHSVSSHYHGAVIQLAAQVLFNVFHEFGRQARSSTHFQCAEMMSVSHVITFAEIMISQRLH